MQRNVNSTEELQHYTKHFAFVCSQGASALSLRMIKEPEAFVSNHYVNDKQIYDH